jgi:hypothetical protein
MSKRLYDSPTHLMEVQGGSFVKSLAACFYAADPANKLKLRAAFSEYFESYEERFRQHLAAVAKAAEVSS